MCAAQTTTNSPSRPLRFDLETAAFKDDPHGTYAQMRAAGPILSIRVPFVGKAWVTTTHAATLALLKDNDLFVQEGRHAGKPGVAGLQWWMPQRLRLLADNMLLKDEPDHRRLRKLVDRAFARRDVQAMRGDIDAIADSLLDRLAGRAEVDLANEFSRRLPLEVICDLLGLPDADRGAFVDWSRGALAFRGSLGLMRAMGSLRRMEDYLRGEIEACRRSPRPGLISELVRSEEEGDALSESELLSMVFLLLIAGFETTTHLISGSVLTLERNPDQKAWLLADLPGRAERAVEELARHVSAVQSTKPRYVARDTEFFGRSLRRGELVMALVAAANADPAAFDRPEALQLERFPNPHLAFSSGIHFCLGQQLARIETQSALTRLYGRFPHLELAFGGRPEWGERFGLRGLNRLPVRLEPVPVRQAA